MARAVAQSLIRIPRSLSSSPASNSSSACMGIGGGAFHVSFKNYHYIPSESITFQLSESSSSSSLSPETLRRIEDAIHGIVVKRSAPAWLPFVPGTAYWVPPRRPGCGIAQLLQNARNIKVVAHEELMSITSSRGWPCSTFYIEEASLDPDEAEPPSGISLSVDSDG